MGQKAVKTIDLSEQEKTKKPSQKTENKSAASKPAEAKSKSVKKTKKTSKPKKEVKKSKQRSKRYLNLKNKVDLEKNYPLDQAVDLLLSLAKSKTDETVELHIVAKEKLSGQISLPHGTGKIQKIEIATDKTLKKLEKENIDFDVLVASPKMMPKLAKYAKLLGPKGLMPNPKTNTISDKPEELVKNRQKGDVFYKTEPKFDLIHLIVGKASFGTKKILENTELVIKEIRPARIKKAVLTASQSPGIKLEIKKI